MLLCSIDFETTGLDFNTDRVTEVGAVLYSTTRNRQLMTKGYLVDNEIPVSAEITDITGISTPMIDKFGLSSRTALDDLLNMIDMSEAVIGQNITDFDWPFLKSWCLREKQDLPDRLVIDTRMDLPGVESKHLGYMCADAGFLNPFPHCAISDALSVIRLVSDHDIDAVLARANSPRVTLVADVDYDHKHLAKKHKYMWKDERKVWFKNLKELDVNDEVKNVPFNVAKVDWIPFH
jgi:DNA polymerase-3 subunit epsilon